MALTIRMRIDDHDEHSYYYATGDGTEIELIPLSVNANGVFEPDEGKAYNKVTVNVPQTELETLVANTNQTYTAPSGKAYNVVEVNVPKVVELQNKTVTITANGSKSVSADTGYDGLGTVTMNTNVPNTYTQADEGKVVDNGALVAQTSKNISSNGTVDTTKNNQVVVSVPNTYSAGDEGKVVRNGSLVAQTENVELTENGTYDTTRIASVTVSVSGGVSNVDVAYVTDPGMSGATKLINIRQGEQPQAIYVFSAAPDSLSYSDADIITNFACCINSTYDGINYTYDSVVESKNVNLPIPTLDFNERLILDGYVPTILPYSSGIDAFGIDSEILYGYFLDGNENNGFGLFGDYIAVVIYGVKPPVE